MSKIGRNKKIEKMLQTKNATAEIGELTSV